MSIGIYIRTEKIRKILSEAHKRRGTIPPSRKGAPPNKTSFKKGHGKGISKAFSLKHCENLSKSHKGKIPWNKGMGNLTSEHKRIRNSIEYRLWREAVFARNNWTCQKCNMKGGYLHPHHIKSFAKFPELRLAIDNGLTTCIKCHKEIHKKVRLSHWR